VQAVSIGKGVEADSWVLSVNWVPDSIERECLTKIAVERSLEITFTNERTVFRTLPKPN
jgi:hypothetical protein